jgi:hypothetical protein
MSVKPSQQMPARSPERQSDRAPKKRENGQKRQREKIGNGEAGQIENRSGDQQDRQSEEGQQFGDHDALLKKTNGRLRSGRPFPTNCADFTSACSARC